MSFSDSDSEIEFILNLPARKPRRFQSRTDYLNILDEEEFSRRFRMTKASFRLLLSKIRDEIEPATAR